MRDTRVPVTEDASLNVWHRPPAPGSPTVLLIHGLTGTSRWWIPVISHLPKSLGLVAPDVRGRGASSALPGPYGITTMADDMKAVLEHLGIVDAIVAGYSMGAWIGAVLGNRHPDAVERIVMIDGGLPFPVDETLTEDEVLDAVIGPSLQRLSTRFPTKQAYYDFYREHPAFIGWWHSGLENVLDYELREIDGGLAVDANGDAVAESGRDMTLNDEVVDAARSLTVPTELLIVDHGMVGQPGGFIPLPVAIRAAEANPRLRYTMLEGLNHYSLMMGPGSSRVADVIAGR